MLRKFRGAFLCAGMVVSVFLTGCSVVAPAYSPSMDNVEALKKTGATAPIKTGTIAVTPGMAGAKTISLRGNSMASPVGSNYGEYIATALQQELELAKLYNAQSDIVISGTLITNDINAKGISTNSGQIQVRFLVSAGGKVVFDRVKHIERKWESSFAGAVAIPLAANNYALMVQSLVASLIADPDFVKAIRN